jgi:cold shock CspA family protein
MAKDRRFSAWNTRLEEWKTANQAIEIRKNDRFHKPGDYWCHKECYNSNPRKGVKKSPRKSHWRNYWDGTSTHIQACFVTQSEMRKGQTCAITHRVKIMGEDNKTSRQFYSQYFSDLREYLNGGFGASVIPVYQIKEFFDIEEVEQPPKKATNPDFTIIHAGKVERSHTHIVVINENRRRMDDIDKCHDLNTIVIRVTEWEEEAIRDFDGHGAKHFHEEWGQLNDRIKAKRKEEDAKAEEERLAEEKMKEQERKEYSNLLRKYGYLVPEGLSHEEITALHQEHSPAIKKQELEEENELIEAEGRRELERAEDLESRRKIVDRVKKLIDKWGVSSSPNIISYWPRGFDKKHRILDNKQRQKIELLYEFQIECMFILDNWAVGDIDWGEERKSDENNVISLIPEEFSMTKGEMLELVSMCEEIVNSVCEKKNIYDKNEEEKIQKEISKKQKKAEKRNKELDEEKETNLSITGHRETNEERNLREDKEKRVKQYYTELASREKITANNQELKDIIRAWEEGTGFRRMEYGKRGKRDQRDKGLHREMVAEEEERRKRYRNTISEVEELNKRFYQPHKTYKNLIKLCERKLKIIERINSVMDENSQSLLLEGVLPSEIQPMRDILDDARNQPDILNQLVAPLNNLCESFKLKTIPRRILGQDMESYSTEIEYQVKLRTDIMNNINYLKEVKDKQDREALTTGKRNPMENSSWMMKQLDLVLASFDLVLEDVKRGMVKFYNPRKRFGFLSTSEHSRGLHFTSDAVFENTALHKGATVKYIEGRNHKGPTAVLVWNFRTEHL